MGLKKDTRLDLKLHYKRVFEISLIASLTILILAFKLVPQYHKAPPPPKEPDHGGIITAVPNTINKPEPPPPPKPSLVIAAPDDTPELPDYFIPSIDDPIDITKPPKPYVDPAPGVNEEPPFIVFAEVPPEPVGGIEAIQQKIVYPEMARKVGVEGKVIINAFVDEHGNVVKTEIAKGIGFGCDEAAAQAIMQTKFIPGKQRDKYVRVRVAVPIIFRLR